VLTSYAGLQLMPENADRTIRLKPSLMQLLPFLKLWEYIELAMKPDVFPYVKVTVTVEAGIKPEGDDPTLSS
jgi:hypothetical protein